MSFTVTADSKPVSEAFLDYHDPIRNVDRHIGPSSSTGVIVISDSIPSATTPGVYTFSLTSAKSGLVSSKPITQHLLVLQQLGLSVTATDTQVVELGNSYKFDFLATLLDASIEGATITFNDPILKSDQHLISGSTAISYEKVIPPNTPVGDYAFAFKASKNGSGTSPVMTKVVRVVPSQATLDLETEFTSLSESSIALRWKDLGAGTQYTVSAVPTGGGSVISFKTTETKALLQNLKSNTIYKITIGTLAGTTKAMEWAPAYRTGVIRLYETNDNTPGHNAGIVITGVGTHAASINGPERQLVDFVLVTDHTAPAPYLALASASVTALTGITDGRVTAISDVTYLVDGGLDVDYYTKGIESLFTLSNPANFATLVEDNEGSSLILPFLLADNHFGRLEIMTQADGKLYGVDSKNNKFIDVRISYQTITGKGYVSRPRPTRGITAPLKSTLQVK